MNNIGFTQSWTGTKVIVDKNCYTEKRVWRAVAIVVDVRRPNKVKPLYKKKLFVTRKPAANMVKGVGLIVHPDIYSRIQDKMRGEIIKQNERMIASAFGVPERLLEPTSFSLSTLEEAVKRFKAMGTQ